MKEVKVNPVKARLISRGGGSAQVVVYSGTGAQRRSITRHLHFSPRTNQWRGRNPDEEALANLDAAEADVQQAKKEYALLKSLVEPLTKAIERVGNNNSVFVEAYKVAFGLNGLKKKLKQLNREITQAAIVWHNAETLLEGLELVIPRNVEFVVY